MPILATTVPLQGKGHHQLRGELHREQVPMSLAVHLLAGILVQLLARAGLANIQVDHPK